VRAIAEATTECAVPSLARNRRRYASLKERRRRPGSCCRPWAPRRVTRTRRRTFVRLFCAGVLRIVTRKPRSGGCTHRAASGVHIHLAWRVALLPTHQRAYAAFRKLKASRHVRIGVRTYLRPVSTGRSRGRSRSRVLAARLTLASQDL